MTKTAKVTVNDKGFTVELLDINDEIRRLEADIIGYEKGTKGQEGLVELWTEDVSETSDIVSDLKNIINIFEDVEKDIDALSPHIKEVRKKKNGLFWKNSGHDIYMAEYITTYFPDFTNAWSTLVMRIDVIDETNCRLSLRQRTLTQ